MTRLGKLHRPSSQVSPLILEGSLECQAISRVAALLFWLVCRRTPSMQEPMLSGWLVVGLTVWALELAIVKSGHVSYAGPTVSDVTYTNGAETSKAAGVKEDGDAVKVE